MGLKMQKCIPLNLFDMQEIKVEKRGDAEKSEMLWKVTPKHRLQNKTPHFTMNDSLPTA